MNSLEVDESDIVIVSHLDPSLKRDNEGEKSQKLENDPIAGTSTNTSAETQQNTPDIHNMFEFQQFMDRQDQNADSGDGKAAMAALNMIDLQSLDEGNTEASVQDNVDARATEMGNSDPLAIVHVEYDPNEKAKRLGRPRKHLNGMPAPTPGDSSTENLEKATVSKFRFDERPVEGPGSRGGDPSLRKNAGKLTDTSAVRKRKQALLNFTRSENSAALGLTTENEQAEVGEERSEVKKEGENAPKENCDDEQKQTEKDTEIDIARETIDSGTSIMTISKIEPGQENGSSVSTVSPEPNEGTDATETTENQVETENQTENDAENVSITDDMAENTDSGKRSVDEEDSANKRLKTKRAPAKKKKAPAKEGKIKKLTLSFKPRASRTSMVREKNRITRTYPGPLVAVHFDLYDDNVIDAEGNAATASERLALGFPVTKCEYAGDIIFLISYLMKFEHIIEIHGLGPEDIEVGLGLAVRRPGDPTTVLPNMEQLFRKLLALVLNRKKPILLSMQRTAIQELRNQYITLGLPEEWRDDQHTRVVTSLPCDPLKDQVDPSRPQVSYEDNYEYQAPAEKFNPFLEKDFEEFGLLGIAKPMDRLVMMRCLAVWSISASNQLKTYLTQVINNQDIPGERDTIYASRAVLKGFQQTVDLKKELESKIAKRNKSLLTPKGTPDPDSILRYIDPTSDPHAHPMALRFNEYIVGDCGFHIGRFYLVKMADASSGAISSIEKMKSVARDSAGVRSSIPSSFKLYVEDVHRVLTNSLGAFGPEFDEQGNEIPTSNTFDRSDFWHVVASNSMELGAFIHHVAQRLGIEDGDSPVVSQSSLAYKPLLNMHQYLSLIHPLLEEYEKLEVSAVGEVRTSRRKKVDYAAEKEWAEEEYHEDEYGHAEEGDDDDYYEDGEVEEYVE